MLQDFFFLLIISHFPQLFIFLSEMCFHTTVKHFVTVVSGCDRQITSPADVSHGGKTVESQQKAAALMRIK